VLASHGEPESIIGAVASIAATHAGAPIDLNGNLTSDGLTSYMWDARNQLASVSGSASATFQYDPLRRRVAKTGGGQTVQFLYDGANGVQELSNGSPLANLLAGPAPDEVWTRVDGQGTRHLLVDGLGSTLAETDSAGASLTQYTYEAFGKTQANGSTSTNAQQFTGRENDAPTTELYFYRARYVSSTTQRFVSEDPIEFAGGLNLYAYTHDDPVNYVDPDGTCDCSVRVRCRSVHHWTKWVGAEHCYIVVSDRQNQYYTLTGGFQGDRLWAWRENGDPIKENSFQDTTVFFRKDAAVCENVECLKQKVEWLQSLNLKYVPNNQNSNSFVSWAMGLCGLPVKLPFWAYGRE